MEQKLTTTEIVKKLIGEITPVGESNEDDKRFENLKHMIELTDNLMSDLFNVAAYGSRHEHSMRKAGTEARKALSGYLELLTT